MPTNSWNGGWHAVLAYSSIASSPGYGSASPASWSSTANASYSCDSSQSTTTTVVSSSLSTLKQSPTSRSKTLVVHAARRRSGDADSMDRRADGCRARRDARCRILDRVPAAREHDGNDQRGRRARVTDPDGATSWADDAPSTPSAASPGAAYDGTRARRASHGPPGAGRRRRRLYRPRWRRSWPARPARRRSVVASCSSR